MSSQRILVVDDDLAVRESLKKVLEHTGYEVIVAEDGTDAEALLNERIDLLILDLNLPERDGWEILELANAGHPLLPVIIITGLVDQLETFSIQGAAVLMQKPVDVPILLQRIEDLLAQPDEERLRRISEGRRTEAVLTRRAGKPALGGSLKVPFFPNRASKTME